MLDADDRLSPGALTPGLLRAVVELSDDAVIVIDGDGTVTSWGLTAERLFGYAPNEIVGQSFVTLVAGHARAEVAMVVDTVLAGDEIRHFETSALRNDGMALPISLSARAVFDDGDATPNATLVVRDITEQRLAQAALAEVETRLRDSETLAGVGSWLWDVGSGAMQWSDEAHRLHGVDPLDFDGTYDSHLAAVHPADRERVGTAMERAVESGRVFDEEYRIVRADGELRLVRARAQPTFGGGATALGLRGVVQDVTDRLPAES